MMESVNPMEARQRRIELRRQSTLRSVQKRYHDDDTVDNDDDRSVSSSTSKDISTTSSFSVTASTSRNKKQKCSEVTSSNAEVDLSIYRGIKKQARYEPTIPMWSKAELAAWRKEARRIRNRESAAASRNKTRVRIDELEGQLSTMQNQHSTALQRIAELESLLAQHIQCVSTVSPPQASSPKDSSTIHVSPVLLPSKPEASPTELSIDNDSTEDTEPLIWSPDHQSAAEALANSLMYDISPSDSITIPNVVAPDLIPQSSQSTSCVSNNTNIESITSLTSTNGLNTTHQNIKISRPTAAKTIHSGESKQYISTSTKSNTATSVQDTTVAKSNDDMMEHSHPFGDNFWNCDGVAASTAKDTSTESGVHDDSMFHSVEISTFQDIFTDDATLKWMATATASEELEVDMSTNVSDESPGQYVQVDDVDDDMLGDFLWDALVCN